MLTDTEKEDMRLFDLANEKGKFALEIGLPDAVIQYALERAQINDWVRLIDVTPLANAPSGVVLRVFLLTPSGFRHKAKLDHARNMPPRGHA